jgi:hypothetical protein
MPDGSDFKSSVDEVQVTTKGGFWRKVGDFFKDLGNGIANGFDRLFYTFQWGNGSGNYDEKSPKYASDAVVNLAKSGGVEKIKTSLTKYTSAPNSKGKGEDKIAEDLKDNAMEPDESLNNNGSKDKPAIGKADKDTVIDGEPFGTLKDPVKQTVDKADLLQNGKNATIKSYSINGGQVYPYQK